MIADADNERDRLQDLLLNTHAAVFVDLHLADTTVPLSERLEQAHRLVTGVFDPENPLLSIEAMQDRAQGILGMGWEELGSRAGEVKAKLLAFYFELPSGPGTSHTPSDGKFHRLF